MWWYYLWTFPVDTRRKLSVRKIVRSIYVLCLRGLEMIFKQALISGSFPPDWKKANIVAINKKDNKKAIQFPCSLYVVKPSTDLFLMKSLEFFLDNKLITTNHSGFKPGDSCINQLLSVTQYTYKSFDNWL